MAKNNILKDTIAIIRKDVMLEFHTREVISSMLVFALLVVVVFSFIFEPGEHEQQRIAGGVYWMALVFSGLLGLGKSMLSETSGGNLEALLLTPTSRNAIFLGKVFSNLIFMFALQAVMLPLFVILYEVNLLSDPMMLAVIAATTYGFVLLGTLFSLIASRTRTREIMLPLLLLPVLVPILLAAIQATNAMVAMSPLEDYIKWIRLIVVFDIIFTAISLVVFDPVVEE
ncbi:MAG: heme exporter protein CcmB [Deferribacteraceae bacterium]|jgi:heme exporter protein B|nr:heme exporter protein CcmB [Deferribacteraceae bacterium]